MNILKKLLFYLIAVLMFIVGAGGAYLGLNGGKMNHQAAVNPQTSTNTQEVKPNQSQMNMNMPDQNGTNSQPSNSPGTGKTGETGQAPAAAQTLPAVPPIKVVDPQPYYDRLNQAQNIIDEANKMITVDPFTTNGKDGSMSAPDMSKLHQGIYKMSQGVTAMKETLDSLNGEIKGQTQFGVDPYQAYRYPATPGTSYAIPYNPNGQPNYLYPQGYGYPQGYDPTTGSVVPGANQSHNQQGQQNMQGMTGMQQSQGSQGDNGQMSSMPGMNQAGQADANNSANQNSGNNQGTQSQSSSQQGNGITGLTGNLGFQNIILYVTYGVLTASIIAVFVSIFGIIKGLLKKPEKTSHAGGTANV